MSNRAWVTLATNDSYGLGALVLAHSLRKVVSVNPAIILITPSVTEPMRNRLSAVFAEVITVDVLDSKDEAHLALLQRPELGITFTKIHCWNLTQYEKCVFLDADTLIVQNCDELFDREEFSAAPDVGWPDCFNSGVFVFRPSKDTFGKLIKFAHDCGSFDGGDQGLLNSFFSDWAHGDINKHLPFLYNVTSAAFYSYLPALKHYGQNLKIIHFIGAAKPWLQQYNWESHSVNAPDHLRDFLQLWWDIFVGEVHTVLDISMVDDESGTEVEDDPELEPLNTVHYAPEVNPDSEFPWHHPGESDNESSNEQQLGLTQFYDPWEHHRGNIPGHVDTFNNQENQNRPAYEEPQISNFIWCNENNWNSEQYQDIDNIQWNHTSHHHNHSHHHNWQEQHQHNIHHHSDQQPTTSYDHIQKVITEQHSKHEQKFISDDKQFFDNTQNQHLSQSSGNTDRSNQDKFHDFTHSNTYHFHTLPQKSSSQVVTVYHVHMDHQRIRKRYSRRSTARTTNGDISDTESEGYDDFIPRHPYDGFYLRHRATINPRGHKVCTHEVPIAPSPTPIASPLFTDPEELENGVLSDNIINDDHTGVAGNLAKVKPGASVIQRDALDELSRRQGWEAGNIDYMGADSFDNIWAKISQTLSGLPKEPTPPPKEPTPPPKEPTPALKEPTPPPKEPTPPPKEPSPPKETVPAVEEPTAPVTEQALAPKEPTPPVKEPTPPTKELIEILEKATLSDEPTKEVLQQGLESAAKVAVAFAEISKEAAEVSALVKECLEKDKADVPPTPPATPKSTPEPSTPVTETVPSIVASTQSPAAVAISLSVETTPVKSADLSASDSPPLANTPSTESPAVPAAKTEERRKPASKLLLPAVGAGDALLTPDSEFEDAATLAQSIIASELATPTVSSPSPVAQSPPVVPRQPSQLAPADPEVPTPPVGATVSLAQIGVKPSKVSCAEQIASSLTEQEQATPSSPPASEPSTPTGAPKKKVVKKAAKKEGDAPVPPPRKKEKKPKDK